MVRHLGWSAPLPKIGRSGARYRQCELDGYNEITPRAQQTEADPAEEEYVGSESFIYLNPDRVTEHKHYNIGIELDCSVYVV